MEKTVKANNCGCPSCGATMRYAPDKGDLFCDNCKTCKPIERVAFIEKSPWAEREKLKKDDWLTEEASLKCPACGANVLLNKLEFTKTCPYCDSNLVGNDALSENVAPDAILPFLFSDEEASKRYVAGLKKKWFLPNAIKKQPPVENIRGIYIPTFGYDADTTSTYSGRLATDHTHTDSNGRSYTTTSYQNISGTREDELRDVLVETSTKLNQAQFDKIRPYDVTKAVNFNRGFIMGYTVEVFENTLAECKKFADQEMYDEIRARVLSRYSYDRVERYNMRVEQRNVKFAYYLLPVYKCKYKYKKKEYSTLMNGQTGKVGGGYPKSPVKITFFVLFILALVAGFIAMCVLLGGGD